MQELENIPLFMTKSPEEIDPEKAPGLAALQALKYQTESVMILNTVIAAAIPA